ncbi:hypothetical protein UF06_01250, partial [Vibrio sp. S234-5]
SYEVNAIGWGWYQLAQMPGWGNNRAKAITELLQGAWFEKMPQRGDLAKPRALDVMAALNRMRKSQFRNNN